jgi:hypothetical protein
MSCPECDSEDVVVEPFDFGTCPQTGYLDAGERFRCLCCGATGDTADVDARDPSTISYLRTSSSSQGHE